MIYYQCINKVDKIKCMQLANLNYFATYCYDVINAFLNYLLINFTVLQAIKIVVFTSRNKRSSVWDTKQNSSTHMTFGKQ